MRVMSCWLRIVRTIMKVQIESIPRIASVVNRIVWVRKDEAMRGF
jgi:hypothetical protein